MFAMNTVKQILITLAYTLTRPLSDSTQSFPLTLSTPRPRDCTKIEAKLFNNENSNEE